MSKTHLLPFNGFFFHVEIHVFNVEASIDIRIGLSLYHENISYSVSSFKNPAYCVDMMSSSRFHTNRYIFWTAKIHALL